MAAGQSEAIARGTIADITQRLLIWGRWPGMGLVWVEFSSEFARQAVLQRLQSELSQHQIPFQEIGLPTHQAPAVLADGLLRSLEQCQAGVVSVSGLATAFSQNVLLAEGLLALNLRRELLAQRPLRQIWWMTPVVLQTALHAIPDLMSWFGLRLHLTETVKVEQLRETPSGAAVNVDDAKRRAFQLIQRFEQAQQQPGADGAELLVLYLLPALEALAEANAQKDLRELTGQFEGYLNVLQGMESPELATSLDRLGQLYLKQGRYLEAEPHFKKALKLREGLLRTEHLDVATSLNNLAVLYESQGRYAEAEPLYGRSLSIMEQQLGPEHPDVATSLNNLAGLYKSQGRYAEAEPLYGRSLSIREQQLGPEHPDVATSLNSLAGLYKSQGRYAEAEPLYGRSLKICEATLGQTHPNTVQIRQNVADCCKQMAEQLWRWPMLAAH
jgi:tetratricopeptide (TPR) repeat protein